MVRRGPLFKRLGELSPIKEAIPLSTSFRSVQKIPVISPSCRGRNGGRRKMVGLTHSVLSFFCVDNPLELL